MYNDHDLTLGNNHELGAPDHHLANDLAVVVVVMDRSGFTG